MEEGKGSGFVGLFPLTLFKQRLDFAAGKWYHDEMIRIAALLLLCSLVFASAPVQAQESLSDTLKSAPAAQPQATVNPYADIPDEFIVEARQFYDMCSTTANMFQYYDCKCLATKFLDKRIEMGPVPRTDSITIAIERECPDASEAAGYEYGQCLGKASLLSHGNIPIEDYCTCFANTYARLYENMSAGPSSTTFINLQAQAHTMCRDPKLAKQLYPAKN